MSLFVGLCLLLIVVVLAFLLTPLVVRRAVRKEDTPLIARNATVYREQLAELDLELQRGSIDQAQWNASRSAIERRALDESGEDDAQTETPAAGAPTQRATWTATAVGIIVPVAAVALYALLGTPGALNPESGAGPQQTVTSEQVEAMVAKLAERMKTTPEDTAGWIMLGRSYAAMGRFKDSTSAYAKAIAQRPNDAQTLADYADSLGMANGRNLKGEPEALIARALNADSKNVKALTLAGTVAYQNGEFAKAAKLWKTILPELAADDPFAESVRGIIADAEEKLGTKSATLPGTPRAPHATTNTAPEAAARADAALLQGTVSLSPALKGKVQPGDTVFVYARAETGPRMPLAIMRSTVQELPLKFSLDDSSAMSPAMKLSAFERVVIVARISKSGTPAPQKGDLEGITPVMAPRANGIKLEISKAIE
jgi:cytochrome c-type biogenesis protein CcmH